MQRKCDTLSTRSYLKEKNDNSLIKKNVNVLFIQMGNIKKTCEATFLCDIEFPHF